MVRCSRAFAHAPLFSSIIVNLDMVLARRNMKPKDLAARIGITEANLSPIKQRS